MSSHHGHHGHGMAHSNHQMNASEHHDAPYLGEAVLNIIQGLDNEQETEMLEMLHTPILHSGCKEVFLFPGAVTKTCAQFYFSLLVLVFIVIVLELLRYLGSSVEERLAKPSASCECKGCVNQCSHPSMTSNFDESHSSPSDDSRFYFSFFTGNIGTLFLSFGLTFLTYVIGTLLMLIAMTMNILVILSLAVGCSLGKIIVHYIKYCRSMKKDNKP